MIDKSIGGHVVGVRSNSRLCSQQIERTGIGHRLLLGVLQGHSRWCAKMIAHHASGVRSSASGRIQILGSKVRGIHFVWGPQDEEGAGKHVEVDRSTRLCRSW